MTLANSSVGSANTIHNKNAPLSLKKNALNKELVHIDTTRRYTKRQQVKEIAKKKYDENGGAITILDLQVSFRLTKAQAQRQIKHLHMEKFLFTADDLKKQGIVFKGKKRERPQKYYLMDMKAKIIEDNKNNVQNDTTGISLLEQYKIQTFRESLTQLAPSCPCRYIHKIQIRAKINKEHYGELNLPTKGNSKAKYRLERVNQSQGYPDLEYNIYPNGTVMIFISCSDKPFRLVEEDDIFAINAYLGKVEDRLKNLLSDTRNRIIPSASSWILVGCDINKDIQIDDMAQITGINIQVKSALGVFRAYVKRIGDDKVVQRFEHSLTPDEPISTAFETLRKKSIMDGDSFAL